MTYIPPAQRRRLEERSDGVCEGCGRHLSVKDNGDHLFQPHHCPPVGSGGSKIPYPDCQLVVLHSSCHRQEHDKGCPHTEEWVSRLREVYVGR
jgi:hypothetical protein